MYAAPNPAVLADTPAPARTPFPHLRAGVEGGLQCRTPLLLPSDSSDGETEQSSPAPRPPKKRQRRSVAQTARQSSARQLAWTFVDLEAHDSEAEEEEDDDAQDAGGFIDDALNQSALSSYRNFTLDPADVTREREEEQVELERIAARISARGPIPEYNPHEDGLNQSELLLLAGLGCPLYTLVTPRGHELDLVMYLGRATVARQELVEQQHPREYGEPVEREMPHLLTAGTWGHGCGWIWIETRKLKELQDLLSRWCSKHRLPRRPELVRVEASEYVNILTPPPEPYFPTPLPGNSQCFGRIKCSSGKLGTLYDGDLVFIQEDYNYLLVVPRIDYCQTDTPSKSRPSAQLFSETRFKHAFPRAKLELSGEGRTVYWGDREFHRQSGVEILPARIPHTTRDVAPSSEELELFVAASAPPMNLPFEGPSGALQEGDRVLVIAGAHSTKSGVIMGISDGIAHIMPDLPHRDEEGSQKQSSPAPSWSASDKSLCDLLALRDQTFAAHIPNIRKHLLSQPRSIAVGARVQVVTGNTHLQRSGRVVELPTPRTVVFQVLEPDVADVEIELRHVRVEFRCGDEVRVLRGQHKGDVGFIIAVKLGGYVELYPCQNYAKYFQTHESLESLETRGHHDSIHEMPHARTESIYSISTVDLEFAPVDNPDFLFGGGGDWQGKDRERSIRETLERKEKLAVEWERCLMRTGRLFIGVPVQIIGQHHLKGKRGVVKDYHLTKTTSEGIKSLEWIERATATLFSMKDVIFSVQFEGENRVQDFKFCDVGHKHTGRPLDQRALQVRPAEDRRSRTPEPVGSLEPLTEAEKRDFFELDPVIAKYGPPPDVGESVGTWLMHANLAGKRIDVKIASQEDLARLQTSGEHMRRKINSKTFSLADTHGWLAPFAEPLNKNTIDVISLDYRAAGTAGRSAKMAIRTLRPYRRTPVTPALGNSSCISASPARVVIIGPDVHGRTDRVGEYAETMPTSVHPSRVVQVRFPWEHDEKGRDVQHKADYYLEALCSARNLPLGIAVVTNFDAKKPPLVGSHAIG